MATDSLSISLQHISTHPVNSLLSLATSRAREGTLSEFCFYCQSTQGTPTKSGYPGL